MYRLCRLTSSSAAFRSYAWNKHVPGSSALIHGKFGRKEQEDEGKRYKNLPPVRCYRTTVHVERSGVAIVLGLGAVSASALAASNLVRAYNEWKESTPSPAPENENESESEKSEESTKSTKKEEGASQNDGAKRENIFNTLFNMGAGTRYYEGGFEEKMTRQEAALILGVRESSSTKRIKDAHKKLLILNHPDAGGSTYMAGKINEAKELLLKGKRD
mmetsp:Transcript_28488/g.43798  ORF Transcript_28488/g.43798 Transcript_28488/m.43798 type:complete len:217 (+) Transcript_28488:34-684(+)